MLDGPLYHSSHAMTNSKRMLWSWNIAFEDCKSCFFAWGFVSPSFQEDDFNSLVVFHKFKVMKWQLQWSLTLLWRRFSTLPIWQSWGKHGFICRGKQSLMRTNSKPVENGLSITWPNLAVVVKTRRSLREIVSAQCKWRLVRNNYKLVENADTLPHGLI